MPMTQLLSLSRSARLAGVTRAEIQRHIRRGDLTTFEGEIAVSDRTEWKVLAMQLPSSRIDVLTPE